MPAGAETVWAFPRNTVLLTTCRYVAIVKHPYPGKAQPT